MRRWYCAWTHPNKEFVANRELLNQDFETYLPLHMERSGQKIVPLFRRYIMIRFDPDRDAWGSIMNTRGVGGLIRHAPDRPTPLPDIAIAELMARTSARGVVDDIGNAGPQEPPHGVKPVWQGLGALNSENRRRLLLRLFGEGARQLIEQDAA